MFRNQHCTTAKITCKAANPNPYEAYTSYAGYILQKAQFGNCIGAKATTDSACVAANSAQIGAGPYVVKEFKPGDVVTYIKNANYRDAPAKPCAARRA